MLRPVSSRYLAAALSVGSLFLMAYVDYATGYELIFSAAYLVPVSLCAWYFGRPAVVGMSLASGVASWIVDRLSGHAYQHPIIEFWNAFMCFLVSAITGFLLHLIHRVLNERIKTNAELQKALADLQRSTEEITKLQNGLQVICAWTKQIKVGDRWMTPDEFLSTQLHLKLTHGISPEAAREMAKELNQMIPPKPPPAA